MNMLILWINFKQPGMMGRYIKKHCERVRGFLTYLVVGWFMPKKFLLHIAYVTHTNIVINWPLCSTP